MSSPQLPISPHKSAKKSARTQRPHSDFSFSLTKFSIFLIFSFFKINHLKEFICKGPTLEPIRNTASVTPTTPINVNRLHTKLIDFYKVIPALTTLIKVGITL